MHGVARTADLGATLSEFEARFAYRLRDRGEDAQTLQRVIATQSLDDTTVDLVPAGRAKTRFTFRLRSLVLSDDGGRPECHVLILDDETQRYRAEDRFEQAFGANPAPALILRLQDFRFVRANRGFLDMTGFREEDVIGRSIYEIDILAGAAQRPEAIACLNEGRTVPQMEALLQLPRGMRQGRDRRRPADRIRRRALHAVHVRRSGRPPPGRGGAAPQRRALRDRLSSGAGADAAPLARRRRSASRQRCVPARDGICSRRGTRPDGERLAAMGRCRGWRCARHHRRDAWPCARDGAPAPHQGG